ncbi:hypothetical protein C8J56DRAFT_559607 [Mycena floridula]|nr:hypothetical protein C8J56DRAFT_559607 [Mycena floridula]
MPVPVPRISDSTAAHPVFKKSIDKNGQLNPFQNLTRTLPVSPTGPPPSFGTREQWINSLPSWRRTKPRRIWEDDSRLLAAQDFQQGLAFAANASAIKGLRAQACGPALSEALVADGDADDEMSPIDNGEMDIVYENYERGVFSPVYEDGSPTDACGHEASSSPLEPATPFGDFVDRAVAAAQVCIPYNDNSYAILMDKASPQCCYPAFSMVEPARESVTAPAPPAEVTPTATSGYKKLAGPLSEWVANYVWKACTTSDLNLPPSLTRSSLHSRQQYATSPPSDLATSVHSLLLSTLLQPSAVFLALWYIVRLPVHLGNPRLGAENSNDLRFRAALLGDELSREKDAMEANAPFRLIVLGCMLANKWLDDHTFSNKTWHTISNIPIHMLNNLELLTLAIFEHDLTVPSNDWTQWLACLVSYHTSLACSPSRPQPISRPSTNPHSIVRKALDEIIQAPAACNYNHLHPQPIFLGLDERRREKEAQEQAVDVLEIDLDEDGPLREEYLPKRRISGADSTRQIREAQIPMAADENWERRKVEAEKMLPPPAKWSPAGDEPILRERNRASGHYIAVQAPSVAPAFRLLPYGPNPEVAYGQHWPHGYSSMASNGTVGYIMDVPALHLPVQLGYNPMVLPIPPMQHHSRSHSLSQSHDQDISQRGHMRSYSQSRFEYRCSDIRMTANEFVPPEVDMQWASAGHYAYAAPVFAPYPGGYHQSSWLRT